MLRVLLTFLLLFCLSAIHAQAPDARVMHSLFLIGDGGEPYMKDSPLGKALREKITATGGNSTVLFLGDNIYPSGLPAKDSRKYDLAELPLQTQVGFIQGLAVKGIFIPGNHDWEHWGKKGLEYLHNQQQWIDSLHDANITLLPRNGCPGPVEIALGDNALLIILDTQWFLHQWDKPRDAELCQATTTSEVLTMVEDIFKRNADKRIIVAGHHPLITYGEHGGVFTWKAHIFPLDEITEHLYVPLPLIGSLYPLYRKWFGHIQDIAHPVYKEFGQGLQDIMREYPGSMYVAGHEHALQYIVRDSTHFIVSGSAAKTEFVKKKGDAVFAKDVRGFAQVSLRENGQLSFSFFQVDEKYPKAEEVFAATIPAAGKVTAPSLEMKDFKGETVRVIASDQYRAGKLRQRFLGSNYRSAWAQEIDVPVFDLRAERGGLNVLQKGGGQQTLSLRLADSAGREYVLRSVEKFPERAIPEVLRETFAQDLVQDQISASHPYAALVVAPMAEAVGLYHTNPRLVFIPDDPGLGEYRQTFGNTLALFEERPDEDWSHAPFFGGSRKIISTRKVLEKIADDNDNQVDEKFVLRNRLFDLIIGDWDRHEDQWRWATIEKKKGDVYKPIPRDRDQAFFVNEGMMAKIWSRRWALPKFEGFDEDINWPSGLSFNARHFDRTFLTGLSKDDWIQIAEDIRKDLTDEKIESALRQWPQEIFDLHGERIIRHIKARRDNIVSEAISYYEFLSREVEITGSDKNEKFEVERLSTGDVHVRVYKLTEGSGPGKKLYDRVFRKRETREIRLYGLKGDDVYDITGDSERSILVRVIGGEGKDVLADRSQVKAFGRKTFFYDQPGEGEFQGREVKDLRSLEASVNNYNRTSFEYDRLAPLAYGNYNFDDGIFIGAGFLYQKNGFRKEPFSQRHLFLASIAPVTRSYNFRYQGKFTDVSGKWDLEAEADLKAPNFVNNFFGMGNESVFDKTIDEQPAVRVDEAIHYYRYRFEEMSLYTSLSRNLGNWGNVEFGPMLQRIEMEEPSPDEDRYIEVYAASETPDLFTEFRSYGGVAWQLEAGRHGDGLFNKRGSRISLSGKHLAGLNRANNNFSSYEGSLAFFHSFREKSRLVFAARAGGGINQGSYPFYQAQVLDGKNELRGFRETRFYGDSRLYANFEVRLRLANFRSYLFPASMGILAFHDLGRIWYKNENGIDPSSADGKSDVWHKGVGGGLWFTPFNLAVLSFEAGRSNEGVLAYMRLGFLF